MQRITGFLAALALLLLTACGGATEQPPPPPPHSEQVATLVADLGRLGMVIDTIEDPAAAGGKRQNAHPEQELETKKRKVTSCDRKTKKCTTTTNFEIKKNVYVAEVTVVVSGNCKAQIERVLDVGSNSHYFDETWAGDKANSEEIDIDPNSEFSFMPTPTSLERYFSANGPRPQDFAFCRGKPTTLSPAGRD